MHVFTSKHAEEGDINMIVIDIVNGLMDIRKNKPAIAIGYSIYSRI